MDSPRVARPAPQAPRPLISGMPFSAMSWTGDHKQLRPKVEQYSLRVESGRGFDLNVSLFERLVNKGYPHTTLELQHRMPPEVGGLRQQFFALLLYSAV